MRGRRADLRLYGEAIEIDAKAVFPVRGCSRIFGCVS